MNTYYNNLIEGHNTRPRDIERALSGELDQNEERRNLQIEAAAHVRVQTEIDRMFLKGTLPPATSAGFVQWIHNEFYWDASPAMLTFKNESQEIVMVPGQWRSRPEHDNAVGRHLPPSSERVADFMRYFEQRYSLSQLGTAGRITAIPAAHHRLNYIHPFPVNASFDIKRVGMARHSVYPKCRERRGLSEATAWMDPAVLLIGHDKISVFIASTPALVPFRFHLTDIFRQAIHTLSAEWEAILAAAQLPLEGPANLNRILTGTELPSVLVVLGDGRPYHPTSQPFFSMTRDDRNAVYDGSYSRYAACKRPWEPISPHRCTVTRSGLKRGISTVLSN